MEGDYEDSMECTEAICDLCQETASKCRCGENDDGGSFG